MGWKPAGDRTQGRGIFVQSKQAAPPGDVITLDRRTFLRLSSATALGVFGGSLFGSRVYAATLGKAKRDQMTPDEILARLEAWQSKFQ